MDTKENYMAKIQKHINMDEVISTKEVRKIENNLNVHAEHAAKMTMAGENNGHSKRIKGNLKTKDNQIPVLHGTSKDHKETENETEGPDVRPIMGAVVGPNVALSNFIGREIVRRVAEDASSDNVCKSTEELISRQEQYNRDFNLLGLRSRQAPLLSSSKMVEQHFIEYGLLLTRRKPG